MPQPTKLARIKAKAAQIAAKKAELVSDELDLHASIDTKLANIAQRKRDLATLELEFAEEIADINELDGADATVKAKADKASV